MAVLNDRYSGLRKKQLQGHTRLSSVPVDHHVNLQ